MASMGDLSKIVDGKDLSEGERGPYEEQAKALKVEYDAAMIKFYEEHPELAKPKKEKSVKAPKPRKQKEEKEVEVKMTPEMLKLVEQLKAVKASKKVLDGQLEEKHAMLAKCEKKRAKCNAAGGDQSETLKKLDQMEKLTHGEIEGIRGKMMAAKAEITRVVGEYETLNKAAESKARAAREAEAEARAKAKAEAAANGGGEPSGVDAAAEAKAAEEKERRRAEKRARREAEEKAAAKEAAANRKRDLEFLVAKDDDDGAAVASGGEARAPPRRRRSRRCRWTMRMRSLQLRRSRPRRRRHRRLSARRSSSTRATRPRR